MRYSFFTNPTLAKRSGFYYNIILEVGPWGQKLELWEKVPNWDACIVSRVWHLEYGSSQSKSEERELLFIFYFLKVNFEMIVLFICLTIEKNMMNFNFKLSFFGEGREACKSWRKQDRHLICIICLWETYIWHSINW